MEKQHKRINKELFRHNSIPFLFISIVSSILLFFFGVWIWSRATNNDKLAYWQPTTAQVSTPGTVEYVKPGTGLPYLCKRDINGNITNDFKIMCVGDLHLGHNRDNFTLEVFKRFLDKETPDLVVLNGDTIFNVTDFVQQKQLNKMFEERGQYWTFVLGNHDSAAFARQYGTVKAREVAFNTLCGKEADGSGTQSPHCLASSMLADSNDGVGTHFLNIKGSNGKTMQTLFMFDYFGINHVNNNVINWYETSVQQIKDDSGLSESPESMAFTHVPFRESKFHSLLPSDVSIKYISGIKKEHCGVLPQTNGLIDYFFKHNTTKAIFAHNHLTNLNYELTKDGKKLEMAYCLGLQYNCYSARTFHHFANLSNLAFMLDCSKHWYIDGITNLYVNANQPSIMHHKFCQLENIFEGLEGQLYIRCHLFISYKGEKINLANRIILPIFATVCITYYGFCIYFLIKRKKGIK